MPKKTPPEEYARIVLYIKRYHRRFSAKKISESLGVSKAFVNRICKTLGVHCVNPKGQLTKECEKFCIDNAHKLTLREMAEACNVHLSTVQRHLLKNGYGSKFSLVSKSDVCDVIDTPMSMDEFVEQLTDYDTQ